MKALRLAMIAVLLAGTMVCLAGKDDANKPNAKPVIHITLIKAMESPRLVAAIKAQVDPGLFGNDFELYTATVKLSKKIYKITGTRAQWKRFFAPAYLLPKLAKPRIDR
jgi:hypothetical protein